MRLQHLDSFARAVAMACVLAVTSTSAFAQSGPFHINMATLDAAAQSAAQQPTETVKRLSMDDAVRSALEQNLGIRIQQIDPQISDIGVMQARSHPLSYCRSQRTFSDSRSNAPIRRAVLE